MQQLGEYYLDGGKWAQAGEQYRRAAELMPDNPRPHNNLGLVYRGTGQARGIRGRLPEGDRPRADVLRFRNLGMVLAEAGKYQEASRMLERSIEMRPDQLSGLGAPRIRLSEPARRPGEGQGDLSQGHRARRRPAEGNAEGRVPAGRCRRLLCGHRDERGEPAAARAGGRARAGRFRRCSTRWRSGTKSFTAARRRCGGLQGRRRVATLPDPSCGTPSWPPFAPTHGTARPLAELASNCSHQGR